MELVLRRVAFKPTYTIGKLYINGQYFCDTLEDTDRGLDSSLHSEGYIRSKKVFGKTAIPYGTYRINMNTVSPKFKDRPWAKPFGGIIPRLEEVLGFIAILLHVGNKAEDTDGCPLVGENRVVGGLVNSTDTYHRLMTRHLLPAKNRREEITIKITK
jgi:hypothetical protein